MSRAADHLRRLMAQEGGSITVERFLQEALYHPEFGYYARHVQTVGARGDFSTSATLHPALGQAIAAWLAAHRRDGIISRRAAETQREERSAESEFGQVPFSALPRLGVRLFREMFAPWHVIELGAGTGELASGVLAALGWRARRGLHYHVVEVSAGLRAAQQSRLPRCVHWHDDIADALRAARGCALIFSNEFVDAFPCRQLAFHPGEGEWREVRVGPAGNGFASFAPVGADGPRIERHDRYRQWLETWAPLWRSGRLLTIDYGDAWPQLYHRRPHGTLRAYWRHQRLEGAEVFARAGRQDLTADVNFTDLERWGAAAGWDSDPLLTQADFLHRWLPPKTRRTPDAALAFLLDPSGAGGAFKTLEQRPRGSGGAAGEDGVPFPSP